MHAPTVLEICAGAGGQALGLEQAGFEHSAAVEVDPNACETLRSNRPDWQVLEGDVRDSAVFRAEDHTGVDLLAGGVPCPPFSIAGKGLGALDERDLYNYAVNLVPVIQPKGLLLENVKGLSSKRFDGYRDHVRKLLEGWGYRTSWRLLNAEGFGVPQRRPRYILVALQDEYFEYFHWPEPNDEPPSTVGETLLDEMASEGWPFAKDWASRAQDVAPTVVGGSHKHGGADLGPTGAKRAWALLGVDGHGIADTPPSRSHLADHVPRLTNEMVYQLQGWRKQDKWVISGKKTAKYRQIGNAFPPPVAKEIGQSIRLAVQKQG